MQPGLDVEAFQPEVDAATQAGWYLLRQLDQFLRGDAEGPITRRKAATDYAEDLLGGEAVIGDTPAVEPTRSVK